MSSEKLQALARTCVTATVPGQTFTLYIRGTRYDDRRQITGYCIAGQKRVLFTPLEVFPFNLAEMRQAMLDLKFDFAQRPVSQGETQSNWFMTPCAEDAPPVNFLYMRGASGRQIERRAQDDRFTQIREFEQHYPQG